MTTPNTVTRRQLCADCGQLRAIRALTPFDGALVCFDCADKRWDAAIDAEAARFDPDIRFERALANLGSWGHP